MSSEDELRPFPLQRGSTFRDTSQRLVVPPSSTIPWWLGRIAWLEYANQCGTDQSQEDIASRGGFGREEFLYFLRAAFQRLEGNTYYFTNIEGWDFVNALVAQTRKDKRE